MAAAEADLSGLLGARRILVLGSPGSGKTHLAAALSGHLGLQLLSLDDFFWKPDRVRLPTDEWRVRVADLVSWPDWIMDGTYEASLDLRLPAAQAIVYIESSRWTCLWRVARRRLRSRWGPIDPSPGHALTAFFVRYVFRFPGATRPEVFGLIARHAPEKPLWVLQGARGVNRLIQRIEQRPDRPSNAVSTAPRPAGLRRNGHA